MEGDARTRFTPKQKAELWERWKSGHVWRTLPERLRGGTRAAFIRSGRQLWCGLSLSNFASALSVRAPRSMSVSPELDHFFLAKRRAGDRWPSGDRASGSMPTAPGMKPAPLPLWCGVRAPRSMSVSPELDHFFLAKRRAGDRWPSGDRASGSMPTAPGMKPAPLPLWCGVRAPRSMSVSPELDHFFLAKRRAGDRWPSGDRASGSMPTAPGMKPAPLPLWCGLSLSNFASALSVRAPRAM